MAISWILFTLMAAFMQAWRNAFQKQLSVTVDAYGVTLARFIFAFPLAGLYLSFLYYQQPVSHIVSFHFKFWLYVGIASLSQILATILLVQLFKQKNYAIGVGLAKSEAILAAIIGVALLGEHLSLLAWLGVFLGAFAIFLLSKGGIQSTKFSWNTLIIGTGSGLCFAITSLLVRQASLQLDMLPVLHRAAWVLFTITGIQCFVLLFFLLIFKRATLWALWNRLGLVFRISFSSCVASMGWFTAMSMQSVAIVTTLGQIEILFSLLISVYLFKEKLVSTDHWGLFWVVIAATLVIWA
ncbi:multidrug transporter [Acinetobacter sp. Ac_877]|uniref:DMT family transporter n=1 Tax=Acinetobacter portensis TaxID=1839785 RepID=UPI00128DF857|nr:DMT family transporter [Acinetobacter portensis]MPW40509.1 multidrug transporter [Acinetobacter portensis]